MVTLNERANKLQVSVKKNGRAGSLFRCRADHGTLCFPVARGKAAFMLTLRRLKEIVDAPKMGERTPSAKHLMECEKAVAWKGLGEGMEIAAYQNGYALYRVHQVATVFSIHACGGYHGYQGGTEDVPYMEREGFEREAWYLRLVLEGEDRLCHNQEAKERRKTISYSTIAEDWKVMETERDPVLEHVVMEETMDDYLRLLTSKQRLAIRKYYWEQETQAQIARELGISCAAVSRMLSRAVQRLRGAGVVPGRSK